MKNLVLFMALITLSTQAFAEANFICSFRNIKRVIPIAEQHSRFDKNRHCTVSCMLALKCNDTEVLAVGALKEFRDFFGPGESSQADFKADALGVQLASKGAAKTDPECLSQCDLYYAP